MEEQRCDICLIARVKCIFLNYRYFELWDDLFMIVFVSVWDVRFVFIREQMTKLEAEISMGQIKKTLWFMFQRACEMIAGPIPALR